MVPRVVGECSWQRRVQRVWGGGRMDFYRNDNIARTFK